MLKTYRIAPSILQLCTITYGEALSNPSKLLNSFKNSEYSCDGNEKKTSRFDWFKIYLNRSSRHHPLKELRGARCVKIQFLLELGILVFTTIRNTNDDVFTINDLYRNIVQIQRSS